MPDRDASGNVKPSKAGATGRIGPAVAMIMAVSRAMAGDFGGSIYDDEDARPGGLLIL